MPTRDDVKRAVCEAIDRQSEKIVKVGETIRKNPELLRLGHFDDVDMAMMIHTTPVKEVKKAGSPPRTTAASSRPSSSTAGSRERTGFSP